MIAELAGTSADILRRKTSEITFSQPTTPKVLLGRVNDDVLGPRFANENLHIGEVHSNSGIREYIAVIDRTVGIDIDKMLEGTGRNYHGYNSDFERRRRAIVSDWMDTQGKRRLYGKAWEDFEPHRLLFTNLINAYLLFQRTAARMSAQANGIVNGSIDPEQLAYQEGGDSLPIRLQASERGVAYEFVAGDVEKHGVSLRTDFDGSLLYDDRYGFIAETNVLIPTVRWVVDEKGRREWNLNFLDEKLADECMDKVSDLFLKDCIRDNPDLTFTPDRFNPLLGMLAVVHLLPETSKKWPYAREDLDGRWYTNKPSQVPLLVLERKADILKSRFFPRAEAHYQAHTPKSI